MKLKGMNAYLLWVFEIIRSLPPRKPMGSTEFITPSNIKTCSFTVGRCTRDSHENPMRVSSKKKRAELGLIEKY